MLTNCTPIFRDNGAYLFALVADEEEGDDDEDVRHYLFFFSTFVASRTMCSRSRCTETG